MQHAPAAFYQAHSNGVTYAIARFHSFEEVEAFFLTEMLGKSHLASKVIGTTIIYWNKEEPHDHRQHNDA